MMTPSEQDISSSLVRIETKLENMESELESLRNRLDVKYVTQDEFKPVKLITFGIIAVAMTYFLLSIAKLVIKG